MEFSVQFILPFKVQIIPSETIVKKEMSQMRQLLLKLKIRFPVNNIIAHNPKTDKITSNWKNFFCLIIECPAQSFIANIFITDLDKTVKLSFNKEYRAYSQNNQIKIFCFLEFENLTFICY